MSVDEFRSRVEQPFLALPMESTWWVFAGAAVLGYGMVWMAWRMVSRQGELYWRGPVALLLLAIFVLLGHIWTHQWAMDAGPSIAWEILGQEWQRWSLMAGVGVVAFIGAERWVWPALRYRIMRWSRPLTATDIQLPPADASQAGTWYLPPSRCRDVRRVYRPRRGLLVGLGRYDRPIWWPSSAERPHVHLIGQTGAGKGVWLQSWAWQLADQGQTVIMIDPKGDTWMPRVLHAAAEAAGLPYTYVDLRAPHAQMNLLARLQPRQLEHVMEAGLGVYRTGSEADVYRGQERHAMVQAVRDWRPGQPVSDWYREVVSAQGTDAKEWAAKVWELARVAAICGDTDAEPIADAIDAGGIVYVRGELGVGSVQYAVRCLTRYVMLMARERERDGRRPVTLVLDEAAESLTAPALDALTQARDWGLHLVLAHTSLGDYDQPHIGASYRRVLETIAANCALRMAYRVAPDDAQWISAQAGECREHREMIETQITAGAAHSLRGSGRRLMESDRPYLPAGITAQLPPGLALAMGVPDMPPAVQARVVPIRIDTEPPEARQTASHPYTDPDGSPIDDREPDEPDTPSPIG